MRLEVVVGVDLFDGVEQDLVHRDRAVAEVLGAFDDPDDREVLGGIIPDGGAVGIDHDLAHARGIEKGGDDPVVKWLAVEGGSFVWNAFAAAWERVLRCVVGCW